MIDSMIALAVGLTAGTHTATWGMYKDAPHEGFTVPRYARSIVLSGIYAVVLQRMTGLDVTTAAGLVILFGVTYTIERITLEVYKTFLREQDQSKYFIPMQFAVGGEVVESRAKRWSAGALYLGALVAILLGVAWLERAGPQLPGIAVVALVGTAGGWISAFGGAWKDAPHEGFETLKFFRSPFVAFCYALAIGSLTSNYVYLFLAPIGYTVATIETYKTFFFPNEPRGKFAGKPILYPEMLRRRQYFIPLYAGIWLAILVTGVLALMQRTEGIL